MSSRTTPPPFGHEMRQHFLFDEKWVNLNHGAFGTYPKQVADVRSELLRRVESAPDQFLRYDHLSLLNESRERLATYLHVPVNEIVLVGNATLGLTTVLRNLTFKENDVILCFEGVYDAVEMTLLSMQETLPRVNIRQVQYTSISTDPEYPRDHDGICADFARTVSDLEAEGLHAKLAIFDTITSVPAVRQPFERLTSICRSKNILSLIDGAHGIGQIPLDLSQLDADFFISNCHKWLYVPRGCAVMHVPRWNQELIRTAFPTSWTFQPLLSNTKTSEGRFQNQFSSQATADNTPFYCVSAALDFRHGVCGGEAAVMEYSKQIVQRGADLVARKLGTVVMREPSPPSTPTTTTTTEHQQGSKPYYRGLRDCAMANVLLPLTKIRTDELGIVARWMQRTLPAESHTSVSVFPYRGRAWVRLSGQIYLELADFEWFADVLLELCRRVDRGEASGKDMK